MVPGRPGPRPPMVEPRRDSLVEATASGRIVRWLPNPDGDVDGLILDDGTQVAFAPTQSARLLAAFKLKDSMQVLGRHGSNAKVIRATQIKNTASGQALTLEAADAAGPPPRPPAPAAREALTPMIANGRIASLLFTDRGDANGVLLENGEAVRFPPHVGAQLASDLKVGGTLYARGYGTQGAQGASFEATRIGSSESNARDVFSAPPRPADPSNR